jgi:hypothetical protein
VNKVKVGDMADVELPAYKRSFECEVYFVNHDVDAGSGTFRVKFSLPNPDLKVAPGLHGTVQFRSVHVIP